MKTLNTQLKAAGGSPRGRAPRFRTVIATGTMLLMAATLQADPGGGGDGKSLVVPPVSHPLGRSMAEWSAEHWKWVYSLPVDHHPLYDTADVGTGQPFEHVWFIGGTYTATPDSDGNVAAVAKRKVNIPVGTALFFPVIDTEASVLEGNGTTESELRNTAEWLQDHARDMTCTVDGKPVRHLDHYRVQSPLFTIGPLPENDVFTASGVPAAAGTTTDSVSDGVFVMVLPLTLGKHTIHFSGRLVFTAANDGFDFVFSQDITYEINIVAPYGHGP